MMEEMLMRQLFGDGQGWLQATMMGCLFLVLIFRPERIQRPALFRCCCWFFALSILVPPAIYCCLWLIGELGMVIRSYRSSRGPGSLTTLLLMVRNVSGPLLIGLSFVCGFLSLGPDPRQASRPGPPRHPLE